MCHGMNFLIGYGCGLHNPHGQSHLASWLMFPEQKAEVIECSDGLRAKDESGWQSNPGGQEVKQRLDKERVKEAIASALTQRMMRCHQAREGSGFPCHKALHSQ